MVRQVLPFNARAYRGSEIHEVEELLEHCDHQVELPVGEELSNRRLVILDKNIRRFVVWPVEANWSVKCYLIFNDEVAYDECDVGSDQGVLHVPTGFVKN